MAKVNKNAINRRATKIENGWEEGAPAVKFRKISLTDLKAKRAEITTAEAEADDLETQLRMKENQINDLYGELDDLIINVGEGVRGHDDYGSDSPLYGGMGFVRKSQRKSGLTRKKKNGTNNDNQ